MIENDRLWMLVIYDHPKDYPDEFVCRRCTAASGRVVFEQTLFARGPTLDSVRSQLPPGEVCLGREANDDPVIVETWI